jgi:hypothetical protein
MFALVVLWLFTTPSFYQGAVLLKGRAALILSKLEIEIKTPKTKLLGSQYRGVYSISHELSGTVVQVANYKRSLEREFFMLERRSELKIESFEPPCVIIAGNYESELDSPNKKKAFDLFRSRLQGVEIITYDELFGKVCLLVDLLEGKTTVDQVFDNDVPF